jgi:uncharacterized C2H2 Zn-finger protein
MSTMGEVEYKCPICNENFNYITQFSYTTFGCYLDFKPYGAAQIPTPVPRCPKCNFVFFEKMFSKKEINIIIKKLNAYNIFELEPNMPNYYYLAKEFELLDKDVESIIYYYHSAIWENNNKNIFKKISSIILKYFETIDKSNKNYYTYQLIKIDFLRRLKKFSIANDLVDYLLIDDENLPNEYINIVGYQNVLIYKKDAEEHEMPNEEK